MLYVHPRVPPCLARAGAIKGLLLALHGLMRSIAGQAISSTCLDLSSGVGDVDGGVDGYGDSHGDGDGVGDARNRDAGDNEGARARHVDP